MDRCCEIIENQEDGEVIAVTLRTENGQLQASCAQGYENMLQSVVSFECRTEDGELIGLADDMDEWFDLLPKCFNSTYGYARLVV